MVDDSSSEIGDAQTRHYSSAIGHRTPVELISGILKFSNDAQPVKIYSSYSEIPFTYEILDKEGWEDRVRELVKVWVEDDENISRAAKHVKRNPTSTGFGLVRGYCMFRQKAVELPDWVQPDGLGIGEQEPQTIVFIALKSLNPENGFFMRLEDGHDVCLDSKADVRFPPTGGGLGILISLNL